MVIKKIQKQIYDFYLFVGNITRNENKIVTSFEFITNNIK